MNLGNKPNLETPQELSAMRKLMFAIAIVFGTLTITNAQSSSPETPTKALLASVQDDYKEVNVSELPQAVKDAIAKDLEGAVVSKAYTNGKGEFKLVVTTADEMSKTLFINKKGEWKKEQ